ncbi:predicted GPI-anchored protein 58 [Prionailurus bengalensis]|uniref:predicted GPI-anchored protein 58 n=1 Tax=Prionailurus bengalensis TaxID=37029 RepID=UPI001CA9117E|nr:predicted GPI-anchored protein 58 [Prionailurus bengalensis]
MDSQPLGPLPPPPAVPDSSHPIPLATPRSQLLPRQPAVPNQAPRLRPRPRCSGPNPLVVPTLQARGPVPSVPALSWLQAAVSPPHFLPLRPLDPHRPGAGSSRAPPAHGLPSPAPGIPATYSMEPNASGNACVTGLGLQSGLHSGRHAGHFSAPVAALLAALRALLALATVLGNSLIVVVFAVDRSLRSSDNFLLNLAVADLLVGECRLGTGGTQVALQRRTLRSKVSFKSWGALGHPRPGWSWQPGGRATAPLCPQAASASHCTSPTS